MAKKTEKIQEIDQEPDNAEKLQLMIDQLQKENKKILSQNAELITEKNFLSEQLDDLENVIKSDKPEEKKQITKKINKAGGRQYNINDYVFYEEKYQRKPFVISRLVDEYKGENQYKIMSEDGTVVEAMVAESKLRLNDRKSFQRDFQIY